VELVGRNPDVIVTAGINAAVAAKRATSTIPIVTATGADLVSLGLVASLRHPGGNVTGMTSITSDLAGKRVELAKTLTPRATRIGILWDDRNPASHLIVRETEAAAGTAGVTLQRAPVRTPADLDRAFAGVARERAGALLIVQSPMFFAHLNRLAQLATRHRLPTIVGSREYAEAGGLVSYGTDYPELFRRAAVFVDKVLKGAKPGDLPVEQPTKFELIVNMKTAKALGVTVPPSLLELADHVIR
jgi:putative ABC transport system substrate-binding protein